MFLVTDVEEFEPCEDSSDESISDNEGKLNCFTYFTLVLGTEQTESAVLDIFPLIFIYIDSGQLAFCH